MWCDICNLNVRGKGKEMKKHKQTQKHRLHKSKSLFRSHLKAKGERAKREYKEKEQQKSEPKEKVDPAAFIVKADVLEEGKEPLSQTTWRKIFDFGNNKIFYENQLTGQRFENKPFGLEDENIDTVAIDESGPYVTNHWEEVHEREKVFGSDQDMLLDRKKETEQNRLIHLDDKMERQWYESGNDINKAVNELLKTGKRETRSDRFDKLETLARLNFETSFVPATNEVELVTNTMAKKPDFSVFKKRRIKK